MILPPDSQQPGTSISVAETAVQTSQWRRMARLTLGVLLLIGGIAGLFLPILQGGLMIMAAFAILRKDWLWAARVWDRWILPTQYRLQRLWGRIRQRKE